VDRPDLIGQEWKIAEHFLASTSYSVEKVLTTPPWSGIGQGKLRIVRQKYISEDKLELVVAYDIYSKN